MTLHNLDPSAQSHIVVVDRVVVASFPDMQSAFLRAESLFDLCEEDVHVISFIKTDSGYLCFPTNMVDFLFDEEDDFDPDEEDDFDPDDDEEEWKSA